MYQEGIFDTTTICVDEYKDKCLSGRLYNSSYTDGLSFQSTIDLLLNMETALGGKNQPQAYTCRRLFRPIEERPVVEATQIERKDGKLATFSLKILFRQNASWQGSVFWHEGKQEERFRSVLELLLLINSALSLEKL
jgi:hypothetical protein